MISAKGHVPYRGTIITKEGHVLTHAHYDLEIKPGTAVRVIAGDGRKAVGKSCTTLSSKGGTTSMSGLGRHNYLLREVHSSVSGFSSRA